MSYGKHAVVALPIVGHRKHPFVALLLAAGIVLPALVAIMFGFAYLTEWLQIDWGPTGLGFPS